MLTNKKMETEWQKNNQTREVADNCSNIFLCLFDSDWLRTVSINH